MKDKGKWIKELRSRMEDYSEPLPSGLWERLDGELKAPRPVPMWRTGRFAAAAAVVLVAVSSLTAWFMLSPQADYVRSNRQVAEEIRQAASGSGTEPLRVTEKRARLAEGSSARRNGLPPASAKPLAMVVLPEGEGLEETVSVPKAEAYALAAAEDGEKETPAGGEQAVDAGQADGRRRRMEADRRRMQRNREQAQPRVREGRRGWAVGIAAGNTPYSSSNSFGGFGRLDAGALHAAGSASTASVSGHHSVYRQVLLDNRDRSATTDIRHKMPVTVGASVKWDINGAWALETGLAYTMLSSELRSGGESYWQEEQKLHYIGIPLKVHRSIWGNRWVSLYASAGGMVEKCVSAGQDVVYVSGNTSRDTEHRKLDVDRLQWSVAASLGAQVNFARQFGLYVEPGVAYYFDDGSGVETIRKEHPLNFSLQLGLRFSFAR